MNPIYWDLGDGVVIRTLTLDDADELFALVDANRARLRDWMIWEPTTLSPTDVRAFIERCLASESDAEGNGIWVDGRIAGVIGLRIDTLSNGGEVGYWIDRDHEGRGIMTRACIRFFEFAFEEMGMHRMELHAAAENSRSRAIAERLGMTQEGVARDGIRVPAGYQDAVVYGMLEDEWRARRA